MDRDTNAKARLPGSGGANDVGSFSHRTIIIVQGQDRRKFVEHLDFLTTPGYLTGPGARERAGLPANQAVSSLPSWAIYGFDPDSCRMRLLALHPQVSRDEVQANSSGFAIPVVEDLTISPPPTRIYQNAGCLLEMDPEGMLIGR